jgi:tetratricopeptide (TPR) repeat protein
MAEVAEAAASGENPGPADEAGQAIADQAVRLAESGDLDAALALIQRARSGEPDEAALRLGRLLDSRGLTGRAEAAYRRADEQESPEGALNLGIRLQLRGDLASAGAAYQRADARGSPQAIGHLVRILVLQAEREQAEELVEQAAAGPDPARLFAATYALADVLTFLNMPAAAEPAARRAIEADPRSYPARYLLAAILTMRGHREEAEEALRAAAEIGPGDRRAAGSQAAAPARAREGQEPGPPDEEHRTSSGRLLRALRSLRPSGSGPEQLPDDARAAAIGELSKLAGGLTFGLARMIAGHQDVGLPVTAAILDRLILELGPLLSRGDAYRPNFGQYGEIQITGDLSEQARIDVSYTDSSVRENLARRIIVSHPRDIRLTAWASPPYDVASALNFTMVHGRPASAVALQGGAVDSPADGPPWPQRPAGPDAGTDPEDGCRRSGCRRAPVGRTGACLEHIEPSRRQEALAGHSGGLDASGMTITADLLAAILTSSAARAVNFDASCFDTVADFRDRLFIGNMSFEFASFRHAALFARSTFTQVTSFSGAEFWSEAVFDRARFHSAALFEAVVFRGDASFEKCVVHGGASFSSAEFRQAAVFGDCQFRADVRSVFTNYLTGAATFAGAVFGQPPAFSSVLVGGVCDFDAARFESGLLVTMNIACSAASFAETSFAGGADLALSPCDVILDGANFGQVSTLTTWRLFPFPETRAEIQENPQATVRLASVRGARIGLLRLDEVDLRACRFDRAHGLDTARIAGPDVFAGPPRGFRVRRPVVAEEWSWRSYGRRGGPSLERIGAGISITRPSGTRGWAQIPPECEPPDVLAEEPGAISRRKIMATYHDLRVGREQMNDQANAAGFYYSEMQMRGEHDHSSVLNPEKTRSWIELILVRIFWVISGYDVRPARSIVSFAVVILAGALVLWQWGYRAGVSFGHAAITSLAAATALFGGVDWNLLTDSGQLTEIFLRVAGPILLALTALGIRSLARR